MFICAPTPLKELITFLNVYLTAPVGGRFPRTVEDIRDHEFFQCQPGFFSHLSQVLILEALAWVIVWHFGSGWLVTIFISFLLTVAQVIGVLIPGSGSMGSLRIFSSLFTLVSATAWHFLASYSSVSDTSKLSKPTGPQFSHL